MANTVQALTGHGDGAAVLALRGPIRYPAARALRRLIDELTLVDDTVVLDLRGTTSVDSTGMGLLARVARQALGRTGRRAIIVCPENDVATALRSAAFDELCAMVDTPPYDEEPALTEVPLVEPSSSHDAFGRVILDAHRELGDVAPKNRAEYAAVIAALEAELVPGRR